MRLAKIKNNYLFKGDKPDGTHTYAVYYDKPSKRYRAVALTHLYVKDDKRFKQVKKGNIRVKVERRYLSKTQSKRIKDFATKRYKGKTGKKKSHR